jgi:DNA modification methylase
MVIPINEIVTGDCRSWMNLWQPESIGCILTSPPYNVGLNYEGYNDNLPDAEFRQFNAEWLTAAYRVAMDNSRMYVIVSNKMERWYPDLGESLGWKYIQRLTWCKPNFASGVSRKNMDWSVMSEDILLFHKGRPDKMLKTESVSYNWFIETVPQTNFKEGRIHVAQVPLGLAMHIIERTPGEPILDPFAGSGQICRAAKALGRSYIGIELSPIVAERARHFIAGETPRNYNAAQMNMEMTL